MNLEEAHVLCLGNLKQAALYFDRVVPIQFFKLQGHPKGSFVEVPEKIPTKVISELIYGSGTPEWRILEFLEKVWDPFMKNIHNEFKGFPRNSDDWSTLYQSNSLGKNKVSVRKYVIDFASELGIKNPQVLIPENVTNTDYDQAYLSLSLDSVQLANVENVSWDQLMEFRKDSDSVAKLRNLKLHMYEQYTGKPQSFIINHLAMRLDEYESAAKKHGFDLTTSVLTTILDSKTLQASLAAGIGAALFGGVELAVGAACAVEVGKGSLELAKRMYAFKDLKNSHDLAYLIKAKEELERKC